MAIAMLSRRFTDTFGNPLLFCGASALALGVSLGASTPAHAAPQQTTADDDQVGDQDNAPADATADQSSADQAAGLAGTPQQSDDIVVTGYRQSLQNAQAIKKNSNVIVDSVTAEDIGALPDRSVTEALQRVPGVSINRFAAGVDPDHFSVEGSGVTIRGLTYTRSEINGNDAFSAGNGAGINFQDVPSELLGGVDVFKTPSADRIEGGIGGTVNLRTRLPFDQDGAILAGTLEMNYADFVNRGAPVVSVLASDRWDTGIGEIGLLGSFSYSQLFSRADRLGITSFRPRTLYSDGTRNDVVAFDGATAQGSILFPRGAVMGSQEFDRQRYGYSAAAQWRSHDGSMEATFRFLRSDARQAWNEHTIEIATDNVAANADASGVADSRARAGTSIDFDDSGLFESGFITGPTGWRADQQTADIRTPAIGLQSNNIAREHLERNIVDDYSADFRWDITDNLGLKASYQHVNSSASATDNGLWTSGYQDAFIRLNGHEPATVQFIAPQNCESQFFDAASQSCTGTPGTANYPSYFTGAHQSFLDPYNSFYRSAMDHVEESDGNEDSFRADLDYTFPDNGFLKSIQVGGRYADRDQTARFSIYNWGELSEQWGNGGPVWLDDPVDGVQGGSGGAPLTDYEPFFFANYFRNNIASPAGPGRLYYSGSPASDYDGYAAYGTLINREWEPTAQCSDGRTINGGWNRLSERCGNLAGSIFQPGEVNPQSMRNWAAYAMVNIDHGFANGWNLTGNIGVRYTNTRRHSEGFQQFAEAANSLPTAEQCSEPPAEGEDPTPFCSFSPEVQQQARNFLNGALTPNDVDLDYDYWLPSVNLKLAVSDKLQFRAGYFKGVFDPQFGYTRNYFNITGISTVVVVDENGNPVPDEYSLQVTTTRGNAALLPTKADNFDLTAEWYFSRVGQLTGAVFYKRLTDVVTNATASIPLTNNGSTFPVVVTQPVNSDDVGHLKGVELSYQQVFDFLPSVLKGLGLQATYTYVDSSGVPQTTLSATDPDVAAGRQSNITGDNFPLQGLSKHTFNVTPFIDIGNLELRAAYNWRSRYLLTIRDVITPFDPIFQRAYGQLDASATLTVNDHFKIGVQAVNVTNARTTTEAAVFDADENIRYVPRQWYVNDSRFTVLTRISF